MPVGGDTRLGLHAANHTISSAVVPLEVVVVGAYTFGLPRGMAATSRALLYCRGLAAVGDTVRVLLTTVSECPPDVLNTQSRGVVDGIPFEYTTGTPMRAGTFWRRRFDETRGMVVALSRLAALRRGGRRVAILAYVGTSRWSLGYLVLTASARVLRIPVVLDLCEVPWTLRANQRLWERVTSPLAFTSGAITISSYLTRWTNAEYASRHANAIATEIPILVDVDEVQPRPSPHATWTALYASSESDSSLTFVLEAMRYVWAREPRCRLVVTGVSPGELDRQLTEAAFSNADMARVVAAGMVSREALLDLYSEASVCLAPLFDDQRSRARFPTKIGEYAAAARPVVTSSVGEVRRYLEDGATAFIAEPGDPVVFGRKIIEALCNPALAAAIGARARDVAEEHFDYRVHAARLHEAMTRSLLPHYNWRPRLSIGQECLSAEREHR